MLCYVHSLTDWPALMYYQPDNPYFWYIFSRCHPVPQLVITIDLIKNIALLVALAAIYPVLTARLNKSLLSKQVLFCAMFGTVGVLGMMTPIDYGQGVIFDGRSIILAVAGLIGGPLVGAISAAMMMGYRIFLGGGGVFVGIMTILSSVGIGLLFHYFRKRSANFLGPLPLL